METEKYLISVIIPVFNVAQYLPQCLDSVLKQTYKRLEIIVIDDGSTDSSNQICDEYKKKDCRIKTIHQKNGGVPVARNAGLDVATGNFITFIDSDDWVDSNWIETQLDAILQHNADVAVCAFDCVYKNARTQGKTELPRYLLTEYEDKKNLAFGVGDWSSSTYLCGFVWKLLIRRECLINKTTNRPIQFFQNRHCAEDTLFVAEVVKNCGSLVINEKTTYHYRMRTTSLTGDLRYIFKMVQANLLMHKRCLISDIDLLRESVRYLTTLSRINLDDLEDWQIPLYQKVISTCRSNLKGITKADLETVKIIFAYLYLTKWPSFSLKQKIINSVFPILKSLFRGKNSIKQIKYP